MIKDIIMSIVGFNGRSIPRTISLYTQQKNGIITVEDMAILANTINYEIVDRINPLLPRIYK